MLRNRIIGVKVSLAPKEHTPKHVHQYSKKKSWALGKWSRGSCDLELYVSPGIREGSPRHFWVFPSCRGMVQLTEFEGHLC